ncbi:MAG: 3'-5' exonuclease [Verrucomicrobiales bacterium]|nr:3'-5' exonuclease [Verrucomicrobiota bacterium JB025]
MAWNCLFNHLDAEQRGVLDQLLKATEPQWVRGFAGSGKSVILIHALGQLLAIKPNATACIVTFTHSLKDMLETGRTENARHIRVMTYFEFQKNPFLCDYILVDEVQDLPSATLQILRQYAGVLLVAGDEEQSIFEDRVSPADIQQIVQPQIHSLAVVYRLTEKLKKVVASILPGSKVHSARSGRLQANVSITLAKADNQEAEVAWVWNEAKRFTQTGDPVAILIPKHDLIQTFITGVCRQQGIAPPEIPKNQYKKPDYGVANDYFSRNGVELRYLGNGYGNLNEGDHGRIIYLITYHSAKGLDFETVFLPGLDESLSIANDEPMARRLFYVAATRSRRTLNMSYSSHRPHPLVQGLPKDLVEEIHIRSRPQGGQESEDIDLF